jgi:hypothetical protein
VQVALPVSRYPTSRSWHRLIERMMPGRRQWRTVHVLLGWVVIEPILARLETLNDRVPCILCVVTCMLGR